MYISKAKETEALCVLNDYKSRVEEWGDSSGRILMSKSEIVKVREAEKIKRNVFHPDTGKRVFTPLRMSWFLAVNIPMIFGMISFQRTMTQVMFFQWLNQSYNALLNYSHRNATAPLKDKDIVISYGAAVSASCLVGITARKLANKFSSSSQSLARQRFASAGVAVLSMAIAGSLNLILMRHGELTKGIHISDHEGKDLGLSKLTAKKAVLNSALTRVALPVPNVIVIPTFFWMIEKLGVKLRSSRGIIAADLIAVAIQLYFALPLSLGLFRQNMSSSVSTVEQPFSLAKDSHGKLIDTIYFNKGL